MQISGVDLITELEHIALIFRHVQETDNFLKDWRQFLLLVLKPILTIFSTFSKDMGTYIKRWGLIRPLLILQVCSNWNTRGWKTLLKNKKLSIVCTDVLLSALISCYIINTISNMALILYVSSSPLLAAYSTSSGTSEATHLVYQTIWSMFLHEPSWLRTSVLAPTFAFKGIFASLNDIANSMYFLMKLVLHSFTEGSTAFLPNKNTFLMDDESERGEWKSWLKAQHSEN